MPPRSLTPGCPGPRLRAVYRQGRYRSHPLRPLPVGRGSITRQGREPLKFADDSHKETPSKKLTDAFKSSRSLATTGTLPATNTSSFAAFCPSYPCSIPRATRTGPNRTGEGPACLFRARLKPILATEPLGRIKWDRFWASVSLTFPHFRERTR